MKADALPPWRAGADEHKRRQMLEWLNRELDEIFHADGNISEADFARFIEQVTRSRREATDEAAAVEAAEHGDIEPLRRMFPLHARFINLPVVSGKKGRRWEKRAKVPTEFNDPRYRLALAIEDVGHIRALWKHHFKRVNRPPGEISAEEIAAQRWDLTETEVRNRRLSRERRA